MLEALNIFLLTETAVILQLSFLSENAVVFNVLL